ncbi:MAG: phosphohydrolase [Theionarchaea archaeon DG-70-1]|nr:MAG: phosphohydrolase [Theionarchaea archaeon DG-70-1]
MEEKYQPIKEIVEKELSCSAHDMDHVLRVYHLCLHLAEGEPDIDTDCLKAAALLHDIARVKEDTDTTGEIDHALLGVQMADKILEDLHYPPEKRELINHCIRTHRFRSTVNPQTKEAKILFDADKLDVLGAVGVARCFMVAGRYNETLYVDTPLDEYVKENLVTKTFHGRIKDISKHAPNIEFETKFKHIPDMLYTKKARKMAEERLKFMTQFFERLQKEIKGEQ